MSGINTITSPRLFGVRETSGGVFEFSTGIPDFVFAAISDNSGGCIVTILQAIVELYESLGVEYEPMVPLYSIEGEGAIITTLDELYGIVSPAGAFRRRA